MEGSVVRRTQELLGRVIRKPPLTERLLSKPPFRYLHDVIGEVIRSTGFMKGLYSDTEMKSDNIKEKDAKIAFLQKTIDLVIMVTGEPLAVKPARIVAGHEPERTNELLQAIAKCCLNKVSSEDAVQRVLAGEKPDVRGKPHISSKSQNNEYRDSKTDEHRSRKEGRGDSEIKDRSTSRDPKSKAELKEDEENKRKERESNKHKDNENRHKNLDKDKENERQERERNKTRTSKPGKETDKSREKEKGGGEREKELEHEKERDRERKHEGGREKDRLRESRDKERSRDPEKDRERGKERERDKRRERGKDVESSREQGKDKKSTGSEDNVTRKTVERSTKDNPELDKENENSTRLSKQHSTKGSKQRVRSGSEGTKEASKSISSCAIERISSLLREKVETAMTEEDLGTMGPPSSTAVKHADEKAATILQGNVEAEAAVKQREGETLNASVLEERVVSEATEIANELPSNVTPRLPRPSSARPAPPRIKRVQENTEALQPERDSSAKIFSNVILDKDGDDDDEDDQFLVEAVPQIAEMTEIAAEATVELEDDEKHGGLVKRILETKKDYELSQLPKSAEKEKPLLSEAARRKEKELVSKEIEKFRASVQALCRNTLPLGKMMDYLQEDVDAMNSELQIWKNENRQLEESLQKEQSITDSAVEPLKAQLVELGQLIQEQQEKNRAVRANILKKNEKIQKMILNIHSRR